MGDGVVRTAAAGGCAAVVAGLATAVLGRLAMSLLAARNPEDAGTLSDDGFVMGQLTLGGTAQLTATVLQLGMVGAGLYLLLRPFLLGTGAVRVVTSALGFGVTIAALLVHPDGVDFTRLEPLWLGIALFVALPVLVVALFAALAEHWLREDSWFMTARRSHVAPLLVTWVCAGIGLILLAPLFLITLAMVAFNDRSRDEFHGKRALPMGLRRAGQALLVAIAGLGTISLAGDISTILG
ncbi:MAG TPA: hypothetical protein DEQ43_10210 [Nocardioides bacterium]|nr:hypothetical protein [Nocardioides sp.]